MPQEFEDTKHEFDHIIAEKHHGPTVAENLALACFPCNNHKGPNIAGYDVVTHQTISLFNPRTQSWSEHFEWQGAKLVGRTPVGRVTVDVLEINLRHRVAHREALMDEGVYPT
jgi:hypothetical protein